MANTKRFNQLEKRIKVIESSYLPKISPTGSYSNKEQDDLRAFLLLIHAEIESYFEEVSENKVKTAFKNWKAKRSRSNVLLSLVSFCGDDIHGKDLEDRIHKALTLYISKLKKNHGIKGNNILDILLPVGIEHNSIDLTWLNTMTSFGTNRGEVAHSTAAVQQPLDPVTLKNTVMLIMTEVKKMDQEIKKIK